MQHLLGQMLLVEGQRQQPQQQQQQRQQQQWQQHQTTTTATAAAVDNHSSYLRAGNRNPFYTWLIHACRGC
jgi:hypothetical protein